MPLFRRLVKGVGMALLLGTALYLFFLLAIMSGNPWFQKVGITLFVGVVLFHVVNEKLHSRRESTLLGQLRNLSQEVTHLRGRGGAPAPQPGPASDKLRQDYESLKINYADLKSRLNTQAVSENVLLVLSQVMQQPNFLLVSPIAQEKALRVYVQQLTRKKPESDDEIIAACLKILKTLRPPARP
jgi:hypothetical protein